MVVDISVCIAIGSFGEWGEAYGDGASVGTGGGMLAVWVLQKADICPPKIAATGKPVLVTKQGTVVRRPD